MAAQHYKPNKTLVIIKWMHFKFLLNYTFQKGRIFSIHVFTGGAGGGQRGGGSQILRPNNRWISIHWPQGKKVLA